MHILKGFSQNLVIRLTIASSLGISKGRGNQYKKFNKIAERIASINTYCMICTLILLSTGPALTTTYNYAIKGNFTADDLILPAELK